MPQQINDIKLFLTIAKRPDAKAARIKKNGKNQTKFKIRCAKKLYTLVINDAAKAEKLRQSMDPKLEVQEIKKRK